MRNFHPNQRNRFFAQFLDETIKLIKSITYEFEAVPAVSLTNNLLNCSVQTNAQAPTERAHTRLYANAFLISW